jgi:hypothetical protein
MSCPAVLSTKITTVAVVVASTVAAVMVTLIAVAVPFGVVEVVITVAIKDLFFNFSKLQSNNIYEIDPMVQSHYFWFIMLFLINCFNYTTQGQVC